jgi:uncharacterized membrane protein YphA (DoxX/SURF4 family)
MKNVKLGFRILLGLMYFVFGLNGFLQFLPQGEMPEAAGAFATAMANTGYFFPLVKGTEVLGGLALLSGMFVPLALIILAPVTLNIVLFHAFLAPQGMFIQVFMLIMHLALGYFYFNSYREILKAK